MTTFAYRHVWILLLSTLFTVLKAQTCSLIISGEVRDKHDNSPLPFTEIRISQTGQGTITDEDGHYMLKNICPGNYTIIATHIGCEPQIHSVELSKNIENLNFYPEHHTKLLGEASVYSDAISEPGKVRLSKDELDKLQGKSLTQIIEGVSGVSSIKTGTTIDKPIIHGQYGNRITTLNNGVRQEDQQWGLEHQTNIDPTFAGNMEVVKGPAAIEYGPSAMGGVVKVESSPFIFSGAAEAQASLNYQTNGQALKAGISYSSSLTPALAYRVHLSGNKSGDLHSPDYYLTNTANDGWSGSMALAFKQPNYSTELFYSHYGSRLGILRASHIGNLSDLERALNSSTPLVVEDFSYKIDNPYQNLKHDLLKLKVESNKLRSLRLSAQYGLQFNTREEYDIRIGGRSNTPANSLRLITQTVNMKAQLAASDNWMTDLGISGMLQQNSNDASTGIRPILPNYNKEEVGIYLLQKYIDGNWTVALSSRLDYISSLAQKYDRVQQLQKYNFDFWCFNASASAGYKTSTGWRHELQWSYTQRPPHINELLSEGLHHGAAAIEEGNINLRAEEGQNFAYGLSSNKNSLVHLKAEVYFNLISNYIFLRPHPEPRLTIRGAFPVFEYTQSDVYLGGIDLSNRLNISKVLKYDQSFSYIRGYDRDNREYLIYMPPPRIAHSFLWNPKTGIRFKEAYISLTHTFVARQNHYPENYDPLPPPASYHLLAFKTGIALPLKSSKINLSLSVENLTNTTYRNYLNRQRYYADEAGRNIFLTVNYIF